MYRIAAIVLMVVFYCIYYGKAFSQKKNGITTNQIKKQEKGLASTIGVLMSLATVAVLVVEIVAICLDATLLPDGVRIAGVVLAALGDLVFLLSVATMGDNWRAGVSKAEKTQLVTRGIYSISRNPAFLGFDLVYVGILLIYFSWWHLVFALFAIVMLHLQVVKVEEPFLPTVFGQEYDNYRKKVFRYLGRRS